MGEIQEVFDDIKGAIGDKGFYILIVVAIVFGLYNLVKGSGSSENMGEVVPVTSVSSYPDAVTNANVIIDTIQNSIDYSEGVIVEEIQGLEETVNNNSEITNNYINEGFEAQKENIDKMSNSNELNIKDLQSVINKMNSDLSGTKATSSTKSAVTSYYTYKTKKGLNTSTSIVDALKSIGVDSSMDNRKKIAEANGISNYTGTANQNISLLKKLKSGKLKKV